MRGLSVYDKFFHFSALIKHVKSDILNGIKQTNYLKIIQGKGQDVFKKITEATGDILFNLPAFKTSELWSRKAPTFLYRFEHASKSKGHWFLKGLPLFGNNTQNSSQECPDCVGHGDDLQFIFEPRDEHGNVPPEMELRNSEDIQVRDIFTNAIKDFVTLGKPLDIKGQPWKEFNERTSNYLRINSKPETSEGFRFCEMGLWAGLGVRLQSATCTALGFLKVDTLLPMNPMKGVLGLG